MFEALDKFDRRSLILNILLATSASLIMNGLIYGLSWDKSTDYAPKPAFEPPGYVVGLVWEGLFVLMAFARWLLNAYSKIGAVQARTLITILITFCLLWPFYSLAIGSLIGGLLGNLGTILLTLWVMIRVWRFSKLAAFLILPVGLWVTFATVIVLSQLGWL